MPSIAADPIIVLWTADITGAAGKSAQVTKATITEACNSMCSGATYQLDLAFEIDGQSVPVSASGSFSCAY